MTPSSGRDARDVRDGGAWTFLQARKNDVLYALVRGAILAASWLPLPLVRAFGRSLGSLAYLLFPGARRIAHANVRAVLGIVSPRDRAAFLRSTYRRLGEHLGDAVAAITGRPSAPLPMTDEARACLREALAEGRGVVFASAHLGPWERVAASLVAHGFPLTTIAREPYDPRLSILYERLRGGAGVRVVYRGDGRAPARIVRALRAGALLGAPMDLRSRVPSIDVPFLGHLAPMAIGPARIALRTGAPVVVGTVAERDGHACITCTRIPHLDVTSAGRHASERALTSAISGELSRRILALPGEWPWMHARGLHLADREAPGEQACSRRGASAVSS